MKRRTFIGAASLLAASTQVKAGSPAQKKGVAHQVYFWLKNPSSTEDLNKLIAGIKTLIAIPDILGLHVGTVAPTAKRAAADHSWHVSLLAFTKDVAGEAAYQVHPLHKDFVKNYGMLWEKAQIYDTQLV